MWIRSILLGGPFRGSPDLPVMALCFSLRVVGKGRPAANLSLYIPVRDTTTLVHFGAVVADAPSPLSTPRSATGQAPLRLGKPVRMKCRASPVLLFMRTGRVVAGSVGIVRATVHYHGEHDALEPTKVKRGQGGGRASALAPEL